MRRLWHCRMRCKRDQTRSNGVVASSHHLILVSMGAGSPIPHSLPPRPLNKIHNRLPKMILSCILSKMKSQKPAVQHPLKRWGSPHPHVYLKNWDRRCSSCRDDALLHRETHRDNHLAAGEPQAAGLNVLIPNGTSWAGVLVSLSWSPWHWSPTGFMFFMVT